MSAALLLLGAKVGTDILGAFGQQQIQAAQLRFQRKASEVNQFQLERQGRLLAEQRGRELADARGAQKAQVAGSGILGGRTAQLLDAETQLAFNRITREDQFRTRFGVAQEQSNRGFLEAQIQAGRRQLGLNLLGAGIQGGVQAVSINQATAAGG